MADVRLGGLYADFTARNARFVAGLRQNANAMRRQQRAVTRLRRDVRAFNRNARAMVGQLVSIRSAAVLLAGSGGLGLLTRNQAKFGANLVETSQRLGIQVEQLQLLQRAFQAEGLQINAINIGLQRFTRRLADAQQGNEQLQETFRALDTSIRNADGSLRLAEDVIFDVAAGLQGLGTQQERVLRAFQLFDSEGVAFVNVLQRGDDALRKQLESFRRLGVVTTEEATRLKALDQSYLDLGTAIRTRLAKGVANAASSFKQLNDEIIERLPQGVAGAIDLFKGLGRNLGNIVVLLAAIKGGFAGGRFGLPGAIIGAAAFALGANELVNAVSKSLVSEIERAERNVAHLRRGLEALEKPSFLSQEQADEAAVQQRERLARAEARLAALREKQRRAEGAAASAARSASAGAGGNRLRLPALNGGAVAAAQVQNAGIERTRKLVSDLSAETEKRNIALRQSAELIGLEGAALARAKARARGSG